MLGKSGRNAAMVLCPFFRAHSKTQIGCEGMTDGMTIILAFRDSEGLDTQERIFCRQHYERCEIYRAIMAAKYEQ